MKTLTVQVPEPVFEWLDATARQRQQTPEQAASEALVRIAGGQEPSLAQLLADSKGIGRGDYTDLSVNPRHLEDFGR